MSKLLATLSFVLALIAVAPTATASPLAPVVSLAAAQDVSSVQSAALAKALELAAWAETAKYYTGRNAAYEIVITYDAEHVEAHKALGYKRIKGEWIEGKRKEVIDECEPGVPQTFADMRRAALVELVATLDAALVGVPMTPKVAALRRAELVKLLPFDDSSAMRERLGEIWDAEELRWILIETRDARLVRAAMTAKVAELRAALPEPTESGADEYTRGMKDLDFVSKFAARGVNATSTIGADETKDLLLTSLLTRDVFQAAFPGQGTPGFPTVLYVVEPGQRGRFFEQHELTPPSEIEYRTSVTSSWLKGRLVVGAPTPMLRKDVTAFQTAGYALTEKFDVWVEDGWAQQGLCSYLAFWVTGTRMSFWDIRNTDQYGQKKADTKNWVDRVPPSTAGWLREAKSLVDGGGTMGHFARALSLPTIEMSWEDVVMSHAVAAYLFEARRADLEQILLRMKAGEATLAIFESQLEMPLDELRNRLVRWIDEIEPIVIAADPKAKKPKSGKAPPKGETP